MKMTVKKLYKKYLQIQRDHYEFVSVGEIVNDLHQIVRENMLRTAKRKGETTRIY